MAFREKIAWVAFVSTVLIWGAFFIILAFVPHQARGLAMLGPFIVATVAQAAVMIAAATIWAISAPRDANAPADERDRAIGLRATRLAYLTLILGVVAVIIWLHFGLHGPDTVFALAGAFILAEAVRFGGTALGYRKGV
ncbi:MULTISPECIES: hypothetical protein [unclassified Sphingomonas]|uniref:hypothetical protein n=1 Tax=unclassified Sphingomonas TaxID=196159 RepID=UPI0008372CC3|nr:MULTISPECIES: hypothetical protein [unclassified Sphingomonas]